MHSFKLYRLTGQLSNLWHMAISLYPAKALHYVNLNVSNTELNKTVVEQ